MAISGKKLEDVIKLELRRELRVETKKWLTLDKWNNRKPGLFKGPSDDEEKLGLSAYNDKRYTLPDGIHREPVEYHILLAEG